MRDQSSLAWMIKPTHDPALQTGFEQIRQQSITMPDVLKNIILSKKFVPESEKKSEHFGQIKFLADQIKTDEFFREKKIIKSRR